MNTNTNVTKALMININDGVNDGPLFKAASYEETVLLCLPGDWASYLFKLVKYSLDGTTLTIYHTKPSKERGSLYFTPPDEVVEKMTQCQSLLAPARMLAEHLGLENGVYFTTRNFDDATARPRSVTIFSPLLNKEEVEGLDEEVIDLNEVSPDELSGFFEGHGCPKGVNIHNFYAVERYHIVSFVRQIRRKVVN